MCTKFIDGVLYYVEHEEVLSSTHIIKYDLPAAEKTKVLKELNLYNLNAYALFGSEESLMESLAFKELN
jgi:hypothetical protein